MQKECSEPWDKADAVMDLLLRLYEDQTGQKYEKTRLKGLEEKTA